MNASRKLAALVVVVLGIAALLFAMRSCSPDDGSEVTTPDPSASSSASPSLQAVKMSTTKIEQAIKARLDANAGEATVVECPERVSQKIGTEFSCDVFYESQPDAEAAATAEVEIDGPDGHYTWRSTVKQGE